MEARTILTVVFMIFLVSINGWSHSFFRHMMNSYDEKEILEVIFHNKIIRRHKYTLPGFELAKDSVSVLIKSSLLGRGDLGNAKNILNAVILSRFKG